MIELTRLKELLEYDPEWGDFTWKVRRRGQTNPGDIAGCRGKDGYILIRIDGRLYPAHQLAWLWMTEEWPAQEIDHENRVRGDNSWDNLRLATSAQQKMNNSLRRDNTSGFKGVLRSGRHKWKAVIWVDNWLKNLGSYDTKEEAAEAYAKAAHEYFGEFANPCAA